MGEVKNQIAQIFLRYGLALLNSKTISVDETTFADVILSLPSLVKQKADAEKWRRVINMLEVCQDCPLRYRCVDGCVVEELVDALSEVSND